MNNLIIDSIISLMGKCQKVHIIIVIGSLVVFYFGFIEVEQARNEKIVLEKTVKQQYDPLLSNAQILENSLRKLFILTYLDVQTEEQIIAVLISEIAKSRSVISAIRKRANRSDQSILPLDTHKPINRIELNKRMEFFWVLYWVGCLLSSLITTWYEVICYRFRKRLQSKRSHRERNYNQHDS